MAHEIVRRAFGGFVDLVGGVMRGDVALNKTAVAASAVFLGTFICGIAARQFARSEDAVAFAGLAGGYAASMLSCKILRTNSKESLAAASIGNISALALLGVRPYQQKIAEQGGYNSR